MKEATTHYTLFNAQRLEENLQEIICLQNICEEYFQMKTIITMLCPAPYHTPLLSYDLLL